MELRAWAMQPSVLTWLVGLLGDAAATRMAAGNAALGIANLAAQAADGEGTLQKLREAGAVKGLVGEWQPANLAEL